MSTVVVVCDLEFNRLSSFLVFLSQIFTHYNTDKYLCSILLVQTFNVVATLSWLELSSLSFILK